MAAILSAIGRGFTSNQIIRRLVNNYPKYSNAILSAQAAGYTANQILRKFHNDKTGHQLSEDAFLTEHEKSRKQDDKRKRNRALTVIGVLGTAGAIAAGAYHLANRGGAVNPQVLPAIRQPQAPRQLGYNAPLGIGPISPRSPNQPQVPKGPNNSPQTPQPSLSPQEINKPAPSAPLKDALKNQRDPLKSVELVKNLKLEPRFDLMMKQDYDNETIAQLLKMTMPKPAFLELNKVPGGLDSVVEDYKNYISNNQKQSSELGTKSPQIPENNEIEPQEVTSQTIQREIQQSQEFAPREQEVMRSAPLAMSPKGKIGEIEYSKNGVSAINLDGKSQKFKDNAIQHEPEGVEDAVRHIINSIPENMKSTALQTAIMIPLPEGNIMVTQFYDGKYAWYRDVPEDLYHNIALGTYQPKGEARTGIGEYNPSVVDSRGAGFHTEIKINPKYSSENKGKTWGYASNEYSLLKNIQPILHKISKERYDEKGNLIQTKPRKKST